MNYFGCCNRPRLTAKICRLAALRLRDTLGSGLNVDYTGLASQATWVYDRHAVSEVPLARTPNCAPLLILRSCQCLIRRIFDHFAPMPNLHIIMAWLPPRRPTHMVISLETEYEASEPELRWRCHHRHARPNNSTSRGLLHTSKCYTTRVNVAV